MKDFPYLSRMFCRRMSPVDNDTISYFLTSLEDKVPLPAPGLPNMTILNTFPSLAAFPGSSFDLVVLTNRLREGAVGGLDLPTLNTAEPQFLDDHCRGDTSIGGGGEEEGRDGWGEKSSRSESTRANIYYGETLMGIGEHARRSRNALPTNDLMTKRTRLFRLSSVCV